MTRLAYLAPSSDVEPRAPTTGAKNGPGRLRRHRRAAPEHHKAERGHKKGSGLPEAPRCAESASVKRHKCALGRRTTNRRGQPRATRRRAARARRRRHPRHNANAAPPVRRLDAVGPQRLGRLAPLHEHGGVAPARRPRLAPAPAWRWERRADRGDPRCLIALKGGRSFVNSDAGEADAVSTKEQQRDASSKAPGDGSL